LTGNPHVVELSEREFTVLPGPTQVTAPAWPALMAG
jgi:hypothetical protein